MIYWDYISLCLLPFRFHPNWVQLILHCMKSVSDCILVNGSSYGTFKPSRQGDPLSPYHDYLFFVLSLYEESEISFKF